MTSRQQLGVAVWIGVVFLALTPFACSDSGTTSSTGTGTGTGAAGTTGTGGMSTSTGTMTSGTMSTGTMSTGSMTTTSGTMSTGTFATSTSTSMCLNIGGSCTMGGQCCSGTCTAGVCNLPACTSDGGSCTTNGQCCGGVCGANNTCTPLTNVCKTLGNTCTPPPPGMESTECCSKFCNNGVCSPSSFCRQTNDVCTSAADCCGGNCNITAPNTVGICGDPPTGPSNCGFTDGEVCGPPGMTPATCGGPCCSRACLPYGPTGVFVCQPASGCHPVGDLCTQNSDCCGSLPGQPAAVCTITAPFTVGVCTLPTGCKPNGDVCKLHGTSCNSSCDCCSGNCNQPLADQNKQCSSDADCMAGYHCYGANPTATPPVMGDCAQYTCNLDNVGVPRCSYGQCVMAGQACASSADCCNHLPCVPNPAGTPPYICGTTTCNQACGVCTTNADCCSGLTCITPLGSTTGQCGPCNPTTSSSSSSSTGSTTTTTTTTGSTTSASSSTGTGMCFLYGQSCTTASQCCNGVPCDNATSPCPAGDTTCTCHYPIF